jgi:hypothetical protein
MVEYLTHDPQIKGLNPTTGTKEKKNGNMVYKMGYAQVAQWYNI